MLALPTGQDQSSQYAKKASLSSSKTNFSMLLISLSASVQEINESRNILSILPSDANKILNVMGIQWSFLADQYQTFRARELINHMRLSIIKVGCAN